MNDDDWGDLTENGAPSPGDHEHLSQFAPLVAIAAAGTVVGVLPLFLLGALSAEILADLGFGAAALGAAVSIFHVSAAVTALPLGRLADRVGSLRAMQIAVGLGATAGLCMGLVATSWGTLLPGILLASLGHSLVAPAANRLLVDVIDPTRLGLALGLKQAAPPVATLLGGLSVPLVALTIGWRWAFVLPVILALVLHPLSARVRLEARMTISPLTVTSGMRPTTWTILALATAFCLGTAASSALPVFYVTSAVGIGIPQGTAGLLLAVGSTAAIASRFLAGLMCDRFTRGHLHLCAGLLLAGSAGLALLALSRPASSLGGVVLAMAGTWGFNGVLWYAILTAFPGAPGSVTGAIAPGGMLGGMLGPTIFGVLVERQGYGTAWLSASVLGVLAAATMAYGAHLLAQQDTTPRFGPLRA